MIVAAPSQLLCPPTLLLVGDSIFIPPTARLIIRIQKLAKFNMNARTPHIPSLHSALLVLSTRNVALQPPPPALFLLVPPRIARASPAAVVSCADDSDAAAYPARAAQFGASGDNGAVQWSGQHGAIVPCSSHCLRNPSSSSASQPHAIIFDG